MALFLSTDISGLRTATYPSGAVNKKYIDTISGNLDSKIGTGGGGSGQNYAYTYLVYKDGADYKAQKGTDGSIDSTSTNATTTIAEAIGRASNDGGGTVLVDTGTYVCDGIIAISSNVTLRGVNRYTTILKKENAMSNPLIQGLTKTNFAIDNLTCDGNNGGGTDGNTLELLSCSDFSITNCEVLKTKDNAIKIDSRFSTPTTRQRGVLIDNVHLSGAIDNDRQLLGLRRCDNAIVSNCFLEGCIGNAGNLGFDMSMGHYCTVENITIRNCSGGFKLTASHHPGSGQVGNVCNNVTYIGRGVTDIDTCYGFKTDDAINCTFSNISLSNIGGYGVSLQGISSYNTYDNIVISGVKWTSGYGVIYKDNNSIMTNLIIYSSNGTGLEFIDCHDNTLSNFIIDNCKSRNGINNSYNLTISNGHLVNGTGAFAHGWGILNGSYNIDIDNCLFKDISGEGVTLWSVGNKCKDIFIRNSKFYNGSKNGIWIKNNNHKDIYIKDNKFSGNSTSAIDNDTTGYVSITENIGYVTENSGWSAIANGGTVAHGCASKPTNVSIVPSGGTPLMYSFTVDGTNITVNHSAAGSPTFSWRAIV